ncbi:MAG: diadenylate cyclase CdaA [Longimicrobiaceae bacterium]
MLEQIGLIAPDFKDLLEIGVVALILYRVLALLSGTRAIQMLVGLVLLVGVYFVARMLNLDLLEYLLNNFFQFGVIAALVVFQPELRSALAHLGQNRVLRLFNRLEESQVTEEIVVAARDLSRSRVGAIIALEREVGLEEFIERSGTRLRSRVSAPLLGSIFSPYSPLHDGAVIIRGDSIVAAGVVLPLTQFPVSDKSLGTRHRAAIGLSEESDALVVVVSEETSQISLARRGDLLRDLNSERLAAILSGKASPLPLERTSG